jgi:hypothetical protein
MMVFQSFPLPLCDKVFNADRISGTDQQVPLLLLRKDAIMMPDFRLGHGCVF